VIHRHTEHLARGGNAIVVEGLAHPSGAVNVGVGRRVGQHREHRLRGGLDRRGRSNALGFHTIA
jgi:hypothetical protein